MQNEKIVLKRRPTATPAATDFERLTGEVPVPAAGQILVETLYLSLDPYMGSALKGRHMSGKIEFGDTMPGETIARVVATKHPDFAIGDIVQNRSGWQRYAVAAPPQPGLSGMALAVSSAAIKIERDARVPLSAYLGAYGMPGLTAYAGAVHLLAPKPGQTFAVSAASGAVGSAAGQIARIMGARAVGIAGSDEKCRYVVEQFGFDACVNYKNPDWGAALAVACPDGIDAFFDTVGGPIIETVMKHLAMRGKIILCGNMQQYNSAEILPGPSLTPIVGKRAQINGLVVYDYWDQLPLYRKYAAGWIADGRLKFKEDVADGLADAPEAFARLMAGRNFGKAVVRVAG
ncbi:MAG: NADP-dependent oxidoreductase [Alphaproteobacteria bacterium]